MSTFETTNLLAGLPPEDAVVLLKALGAAEVLNAQFAAHLHAARDPEVTPMLAVAAEFTAVTSRLGAQRAVARGGPGRTEWATRLERLLEVVRKHAEAEEANDPVLNPTVTKSL